MPLELDAPENTIQRRGATWPGGVRRERDLRECDSEWPAQVPNVAASPRGRRADDGPSGCTILSRAVHSRAGRVARPRGAARTRVGHAPRPPSSRAGSAMCPDGGGPGQWPAQQTAGLPPRRTRAAASQGRSPRRRRRNCAPALLPGLRLGRRATSHVNVRETRHDVGKLWQHVSGRLRPRNRAARAARDWSGAVAGAAVPARVVPGGGAGRAVPAPRQKLARPPRRAHEMSTEFPRQAPPAVKSGPKPRAAA
jgi:hypothetical protein